MKKSIELRRQLHRAPELAGQEKITSNTIITFLQDCEPDSLITGIGGYGIAAEFKGKQNGPRILIRCELDALPITESLNIPYRSEVMGVSHKCGHDGHMAIVAGLAEHLQLQRPDRGSVVLMFQPSEETGEGAERVLSDPKFDKVLPDLVLALHNLPGYPLGQLIIGSGPFASSSSGLKIHLQGKTSHAAEPKAGNSPAPAVAQLIQVLSSIPQFYTSLHESAKVTVIHARVGEIAFGTSPGEGDVMVTLRSHTQEMMQLLIDRVASIAGSTADMFGLEITITPTEPFPPTVNDSQIVKLINEAAGKLEMNIHQISHPFAWSEDFGHFTSRFKGALFGLGAGEDHPALHHPDYDFPDDLIDPGISLFMETINNLQEL
ncbi:MAG: amidohydrolase [bacterium]|nr:amidohydrolase [bacterium]